ncbi:hypothetical protein [Alicyclobacillus fodiniaquatilis]|uniref:Uncharacterized protein n=1 Tax=Alicyclobacillus fodiniaquatilis TaxID=1661150 RepID=A0ABW4JLG2_9BACL
MKSQNEDTLLQEFDKMPKHHLSDSAKQQMLSEIQNQKARPQSRFPRWIGSITAGVAALIIAAGGIYGTLNHARHQQSNNTSLATNQKDSSVMHSALNSNWQKIVNQMGEKRAAQLQRMLTQATIVMDKDAFSDDGPPEPDPQGENVLQSDYNHLLQMFPTAVNLIRANPQLVTNMDASSDLPGYVTNQATGKSDEVTDVVALIYRAYKSSMYDLGPSSASAPSPMQSLNRYQCADLFARMNRLLFGNESK